MKKQLTKATGLLCYLGVITLLFDFNWMLLIKPRPILSVMLGMIILTASQYKKEFTKEDLAFSLKWNLIFASFLTTLMSILSFTSSRGQAYMPGWQMTEAILPMLYGSIIYLILSIMFSDSPERSSSRKSHESQDNTDDLTVSFITEQVFRKLGLSNRECHVALKLLENIPNKEIAAQLYISEATVKKHIQNIYQKLGATDRNSFRKIYLEAAGRK